MSDLFNRPFDGSPSEALIKQLMEEEKKFYHRGLINAAWSRMDMIAGVRRLAAILRDAAECPTLHGTTLVKPRWLSDGFGWDWYRSFQRYDSPFCPDCGTKLQQEIL